MSDGERGLDELLGAYALDAVSEDERREIEDYLSVNPRARQEVEEHREVATMLAWTGASAPEGLWERIAEQLDEPAPAPSGELAAVLAFDPSARTTGVGTSGRRARSRQRIARSFGAWAAGTAAAAVIAVVVVATVQDDDGRAPIEEAAERARDDRDSVIATLVAADGTVGGEAVIDEDGHGYLILSSLPELPDDRTYQLWGVMDGGDAISLGVLGPTPEVETFTADGPVTQLVITNEVAGGVVTDGNPDGAFAGSLG